MCVVVLFTNDEWAEKESMSACVLERPRRLDNAKIALPKSHQDPCTFGPRPGNQ